MLRRMAGNKAFLILWKYYK